jgi:hypothetical protein
MADWPINILMIDRQNIKGPIKIQKKIEKKQTVPEKNEQTEL